MVRREKEKSRIRAVRMNNLRWLLGIRKMNRVPNAQIRELCGVTKEVDEGINESILRLFGHVERIENYRIAKRVHVGECACSLSMGSPSKRWIDTVKGYLKKRGLGVRQARRMVHDKSVWRGFVRGNAWCVARGKYP